MITRILNQNIGPVFRATLIGSGILCFLVPAAGFYKMLELHLNGAQALLGAGMVAGLTLQAMILFAVVALAERSFVKRV